MRPPASQATNVPVLSARGLTKVYRMGEVDVVALRGVDLDLAAGGVVVLLGASGCGKSTLLNILGGLDVPTAGEVYYRGEPLSLTALENVAPVTELPSDAMDPAEALRLVGLAARGDHFPSQLSGGEQQRVAIARAIAKRPDVLLCDVPPGALDAATGRLVLEAIARVNAELGTTTAVITHNAPIARMAHRVVSLGDGRITGIVANATRVPAASLVW